MALNQRAASPQTPCCSAGLQDDLVCIPQKMAGSTGNLGPLVLCTRVTNNITLTDPATLRSIHLDVCPLPRTLHLICRAHAWGLCMGLAWRAYPRVTVDSKPRPQSILHGQDYVSRSCCSLCCGDLTPELHCSQQDSSEEAQALNCWRLCRAGSSILARALPACADMQAAVRVRGTGRRAQRPCQQQICGG